MIGRRKPTRDRDGRVVRPFIISFSGVDGAGKTTQIENLESYLQKRGLRVLRLSFWDHVAVLRDLRAGAGQRAVEFCRRPEQRTEASFTPRNHKHIRRWYLSAARIGFYVLDVVRLRHLLKSRELKQYDVVIFDRYIYDQIANLYSQSQAARLYRLALLRYAPAPDLALVLDARPEEAFARKPEYPLEFIQQNRQNFLRLRNLAPQLIVISATGPEEVQSDIQAHLRRSGLVALGGKTEVCKGVTVVEPRSSCRVRTGPTASI
jgi:thymidylate kinase